MPETLSSRTPKWVNPNSSKGMIVLASDLTFVSRISAVTGDIITAATKSWRMRSAATLQQELDIAISVSEI
ncbi:hypothetical protein IEQ34_014491 [Dendrobium chrysotoxum]|uniref:Uncharacterized protein n=1 Tax=Dendrobium chrysotoxum TaxID=161865 RepID=A0AAV7G404_DENCH|nr:hypothetical protein IEQ34_014491 [Dendrobium chrysotoxum]